MAYLKYLVLLTALGCQVLPARSTPASEPPHVGGSHIDAQGTVLRLEKPRLEDSRSYVHLVVSPSDRTPVRLVLGPGWYLDREGIRFEPNQSVRFVGRNVGRTGEEARVEVQRIESGDKSFVLRDQQGRPAWEARP